MMNDNYNQPNYLAIEMFKKFARFEYALKATGFRKALKPQNGVIRAEPDWMAFAACVADLFSDSQNTEFCAAVDYILSDPPRQQVIKSDGSLEWHETSKTGPTKAAVALLHVCQVRNNLFHGGKLDRDGDWFPDQITRRETNY